jgi:hypothetical protein
MVAGECRNRLALPIAGKHPSRGVCARCEHRNGMRGLGDAVAWVISFLPRVKPCMGCKRRQAAMNRGIPFPKKGKRSACGKCSSRVDKPADV